MKNRTPTKLFSFILSVLLLFYATPSVILTDAASAAESRESDESDSVDASFLEDAVRADEPQNEKVLPKNENVLAF